MIVSFAEFAALSSPPVERTTSLAWCGADESEGASSELNVQRCANTEIRSGCWGGPRHG
jgi:hypothetical protein